MHHALHGHHLPSLLGLTVEVASLFGWKGSSGVLVRRASCTAHFACSFLPKFAKGKHPARRNSHPGGSSYDSPSPLHACPGPGEKAKGGRELHPPSWPCCVRLRKSFSQLSQAVAGAARSQITEALPRDPHIEGKGKWLFARSLPGDPFQSTSETPNNMPPDSVSGLWHLPFSAFTSMVTMTPRHYLIFRQTKASL